MIQSETVGRIEGPEDSKPLQTQGFYRLLWDSTPSAAPVKPRPFLMEETGYVGFFYL